MSRSERWATSREKKRVLTEKGSGPVLYCEGEKYFTYTLEGHPIFWGESGTGKTRRGIIPLVLANIKHNEGMIIADPKGEIYANTIEFVSDNYDVYKFDFRRLYQSDNITCWNPLTAPYELWKSGTAENVFRAEQMVNHLAHVMYPVEPNLDPFWMTEARNIFKAAVFALFSYAKPEEVNLSSVYYLFSKGEERFCGSTFLKEFFEMEEKNENVAMQLRSYVTTANDTRSGIRSSFLSRLSMATDSESVRKFLSNDDIHINKLSGDKPVAIYVILPDETPIYEDLAGLLISQLMDHYIYIAENKWGGKLPIRMNFCLDELGNIGKAISNLDHMLSAGRSRNIRVALVLQSISQLDDVYGKSKATTIHDNASVKILFRVSHWDTLSKFSKLCGERETIIDGKVKQEPLIKPSQLAAMDVGQALVMISGKTKFITWLPDFTDIFDEHEVVRTRGLMRKSSPHRNPCIFDIQAYVKNKKKQMLEAMMDNKTESTPERMPFPFLHDSMDINLEEDEFNVDDLIKKIDVRIDELEAEEEEQKKTENKESDSGKNCTVVILNSQSKGRDIKVIREKLKCTLKVVDSMYKNGATEGRVELKGLSKSEAKEVKSGLDEIGDIVIIKEE